jgi:hypothetical protein
MSNVQEMMPPNISPELQRVIRKNTASRFGDHCAHVVIWMLMEYTKNLAPEHKARLMHGLREAMKSADEGLN